MPEEVLEAARLDGAERHLLLEARCAPCVVHLSYLGLDRGNPAACLSALSNGVELRVDLGVIGGQTFVNNASFGAYATVVESPAYRGDKLNTTLNLLPDLLQGHRGARLSARADGVEIRAPQALLVANNPYGTTDIAGLSRRARLDRGILGVVGGRVRNARQAVRCTVAITGSLDEVVELGWLHAKVHHDHKDAEEKEIKDWIRGNAETAND